MDQLVAVDNIVETELVEQGCVLARRLLNSLLCVRVADIQQHEHQQLRYPGYGGGRRKLRWTRKER